MAADSRWVLSWEGVSSLWWEISDTSLSAFVPGIVRSTRLPETLRDAFLLTGENAKSYRHQYANLYFLRLTDLKDVVLNQARKKWEGVAGEIR